MSSASLIGLGHNLTTYTLGQFRTGNPDYFLPPFLGQAFQDHVHERWRSADAHDGNGLQTPFDGVLETGAIWLCASPRGWTGRLLVLRTAPISSKCMCIEDVAFLS
jgi:hypothetical protein